MSDPIVAANSTPIILLHKAGQLELLNSLYLKIHIPEAVYKEIIIDGGDKTNNHDFISTNNWIEVVKIQNAKGKKLFITSLHEGEVETMILAMEMPADLCILDDLLARKYAENVGLNITGTLGVLIAAKNKGYVKEVKPILDKLLDVGMYVDRKLYSSVLATAKEK